MNLAEWLTQASETSRRSLVILTGESGVGKTYLADKLATQNKEKFIDIDSFGERVEYVDADGNTHGKWIVNAEQLVLFLDDHPEVHVLCGTCDNFYQVVGLLSKEWFLSLFYVQAEPHLFKRIQAVKLEEAIRKRMPQNWINGWRSKMSMSAERIRQMYQDSSWVYFLSAAFGMFKVNELNNSGKLTFSVEPPTKWKKYAEELKPEKQLYLDALADSMYEVGTVENTAAEDVQITQGWHRGQSQLKPKFTK